MRDLFWWLAGYFFCLGSAVLFVIEGRALRRAMSLLGQARRHEEESIAICRAAQDLGMGDRLSIVVGPITAQGGVSMDVLKLTDEQQVALAIMAVTAHGHPAAIDGVPRWASSDSTVVAVTPDTDDPKKARAVAIALGKAQVSVTADADMGDGVREIVSTLDIEVVAAEAMSLGITAGAPEPQP